MLDAPNIHICLMARTHLDPMITQNLTQELTIPMFITNKNRCWLSIPNQTRHPKQEGPKSSP